VTDTRRPDARDVAIRWSEGQHDLEHAIALREQVFCVEQGVSREEEIDGRDPEALHLVALEPQGQRVIGTLRLLFNGASVKVGRVAVDQAWRGHGIASRMLAVALDRARAEGCTRARLAAQLQATGVYARAGFAIESQEFEEAGIPHVWMGRELSSADTPAG
jgi:putative N-acetyltransferase (TIGR04045 family)